MRLDRLQMAEPSEKWAHTHTQPFYSSMDFVRDNPGEPVPEETFSLSESFTWKMGKPDNTVFAAVGR